MQRVFVIELQWLNFAAASAIASWFFIYPLSAMYRDFLAGQELS